MADTLIIYYSRRGQNYVNGSIKFLEKGNAERIVEYMRSAIDADVFEVDTVKPYSGDYMTCTAEAKAELRQKARPELKEYLAGVSRYRNIILVGPNWWGVYPMAMYSQLERLDFTGKKVSFVVTHEGSGTGRVLRTLNDACRGAVIGESLAVHGGSVLQSENIVKEWARKAAA